MARLKREAFVAKKEIGRRLRALRQSKGMSQGELGTALGLSQSNVSAIERGDRGPTIHQVGRFAHALGATTDEIIGNGTAPKDSTRLRQGRLLRRVQRIQELPGADQRAVLKFLDALLEKHHRRRSP